MIRLSTRLSIIYKILGIVGSFIFSFFSLIFLLFMLFDGPIGLAIISLLIFLSSIFNFYFFLKIKRVYFSDEFILIKGLWSEEKHDLGIIKEINDYSPLPVFYISLNSKTKFGKRIFYMPNFSTGLKRTNFIYKLISSDEEMDEIEILESYWKYYNERIKI